MKKKAMKKSVYGSRSFTLHRRLLPCQSMTKEPKDITNTVLLEHMHGMEQRLSKKIDVNTKSIDANSKSIKGLAQCMDTLETHLTERIDALDEDITATIRDTVKIRRHVGMHVASE